MGEGSPLGGVMYHYNPKIALEELQEEAVLPHPVKLRDMILRNQLGPQDAQLLNHDFQEYLTRFAELQKIAREILDKLANGQRKTA
jgi:hypothetical protein